MIKRILGAVRQSYRLRRRFLVLFIPFDGYGEYDAVASVERLTRRLFPIYFKRRRLARYVRSFSEVASERGLSAPTRLVLFAHPCRAHTRIAINPINDLESSLGPDWWTHPAGEHEILTAHVCNGARILNRPSYGRVFPRWVSYSEKLDFFVGDPRFAEQWARVSERIVKATWDCDDVSRLLQRVRTIYEEAVAEARDSISFEEDGGVLALHFTRCYRSVTSSEAYNGLQAEHEIAVEGL